MEALGQLADAADLLVKRETEKKQFLKHARNVKLLYDAVKPDRLLHELVPICRVIRALADEIRSLEPPPDLSDVDGEIQKVLDEAISVETAGDPGEPYGDVYDLSQIDFEKLEEDFEEKEQPHSTAERLRNLMKRKIQTMTRKNRTRDHLLEKYQRIVEAYNAGSVEVARHIRELMELMKELREEEKRHVREGLTEEELAIFDILADSDLELNEKQLEALKGLAKELVGKVRDHLVIEWKGDQQKRGAVKTTIKRNLGRLLPREYDRDLCQDKLNEVYAHFHDNYIDAQHNVYAMAG
jgi:type I restriction enzyme R subunit